MPLPDKDTAAGEFVAVLTNETDPDAVPLVDGANVSVTGRVAPAAIVAGNVNPVIVNPEPVTLAAESARDPVPVLDRVTVCVVLLPITTLPNETLVGDALSRKVALAVAVPESVTAGGVLGALVVTVNVPL